MSVEGLAVQRCEGDERQAYWPGRLVWEGDVSRLHSTRLQRDHVLGGDMPGMPT